MKSNCLAFFHSLTGCNKTSFLLGRGKQWVSFTAVTGTFVKMNSLPEKPPTDSRLGMSVTTQGGSGRQSVTGS